MWADYFGNLCNVMDILVILTRWQAERSRTVRLRFTKKLNTHSTNSICIGKQIMLEDSNVDWSKTLDNCKNNQHVIEIIRNKQNFEFIELIFQHALMRRLETCLTFTYIWKNNAICLLADFIKIPFPELSFHQMYVYACQDKSFNK